MIAKRILKTLLFLMMISLVNCQNDDFQKEDYESLNSEQEMKAIFISKKEIPFKILNYVKEKTNNSMKVSITKKRIKLAQSNELNRDTPLGIVQTNKVIAVYNENNIKYTFKVTDPTKPNSVINLIVVDLGTEIIEYFIKYVFDENFPPQQLASGAIDMSVFTGFMVFYDSLGTQIGEYVLFNGENIETSGVSDPCADEDVDTGDGSTNTGSGSGSGSTDSGNVDTGAGTGGEGGNNNSIDTPDCGFEWYFGNCGCGIEYADGHDVSGNDCCNGSPTVLVDTCTGSTVIYRTNNVSKEVSPCADGETGVLINILLINYMDDHCQFERISDFTTNTDTPLANLISNVFFGTDEFNLIFEDVALDEDLDANALTTPPTGLSFNEDSTARILYDNGYLNNATDLSVVMSTAHEYVHVYLMYLYHQNELLTYYPDFTDLNDAFQSFENNPSTDSSENLDQEMHNVYDNFLDWISESIYIYASNNEIDDVTEEYCDKLVIGQHQNTEAFQNLSVEQQQEYSTITLNEENGNEEAKGSKCL